MWHAGLPGPGIEHAASAGVCQCRVLSTGPPGKSPYFFVLCRSLIIYSALISFVLVGELVTAL